MLQNLKSIGTCRNIQNNSYLLPHNILQTFSIFIKRMSLNQSVSMKIKKEEFFVVVRLMQYKKK
jgi:hypothetical protein